uniref:Uncharacterized protein n=1 Tax=Cacopsylla melanoneura TaxID=428564 RepID=A0A8D9B2M4_9HEMI
METHLKLTTYKKYIEVLNKYFKIYPHSPKSPCQTPLQTHGNQKFETFSQVEGSQKYRYLKKSRVIFPNQSESTTLVVLELLPSTWKMISVQFGLGFRTRRFGRFGSSV